MRIGMILDKEFPPDPRVENEAMALIEKGHQVFLFCLHDGSEKESEEVNGIKVSRYFSSTLSYKLSALAYTVPFYSWIMESKIKNFLLKHQIDIIHIHDIRIAGAVFNVNKRLNLKTVLDLHDNFPEIMKHYPHLQKFPGKQLISPKKWKKKEEEFIAKADRVITVSREFMDEVRSRVKIDTRKMRLVPNSVRQSFYKNFESDDQILQKYKDKFVILYLGDTGIRRGLLTVINSIPLLKDKIKQLKFVIVGSNSTDHILKDEVKTLGIEEIVDFEGWQNMSKFPSYIIMSDICVSPLNRNIQHDVAYANKIFQYMSFAKPVLVSNATAQKSLVERINAGLVHQEKDPKDFASKALELYHNKNLRTVLGAHGKQFIEDEFCWEKVSEELCNMYSELENS